MKVRICKLDELQFLRCIQHEVWGSNTQRLGNWRLGDRLIFFVNKAVAGMAEIVGPPFESATPVWDNGPFPYRVPIRFILVQKPSSRIPVEGPVREILRTAWGYSYGWGILTKVPLIGEQAKQLVKLAESKPNELAEVQRDLMRLIDKIVRSEKYS
jgi:hypothetical protein